jgi:hypothetical protein
MRARVYSRAGCWGVCALYLAPALIIISTSFTHRGRGVAARHRGTREWFAPALIHADLSDGELVVLTK